MHGNSTRRLVVASGGDQVVGHVGLHALGAFADRLGLGNALSSRIPPRGERMPLHDRGKVLVQSMLMLAGGGESCADIEHLRAQEDLFGETPSDSTVFRAFREIAPATRGRAGRGVRRSARRGMGTFGRHHGHGAGDPRHRRLARRDPHRDQGGNGSALLLLTELRVYEAAGIASAESLSWLRSRPMSEERDLSALVVPRAGAVDAGGDMWEPVRMVDAAGERVPAVAAFLKDLQASGLSVSTQRSYAMDLLRWFRFVWAIEVPWNEATRVEACDFCRWLAYADKATRAPAVGRSMNNAPNPVTGKSRPGRSYSGHDACALGDRAEGLLRLPPRCWDGSDGQPIFALEGSSRWQGQCPPQSDGSLPQ